MSSAPRSNTLRLAVQDGGDYQTVLPVSSPSFRRGWQGSKMCGIDSGRHPNPIRADVHSSMLSSNRLDVNRPFFERLALVRQVLPPVIYRFHSGLAVAQDPLGDMRQDAEP